MNLAMDEPRIYIKYKWIITSATTDYGIRYDIIKTVRERIQFRMLATILLSRILNKFNL